MENIRGGRTGEDCGLVHVTLGLPRVHQGRNLHWKAGHALELNGPLPAPRFGQIPDQPAGLRLFTVQIPHKHLQKKRPSCYLTAWDGSTFLPLRTKSCGHEIVSCLNVRCETVWAWLGKGCSGELGKESCPSP